jgi:hypothetical protein
MIFMKNYYVALLAALLTACGGASTSAITYGFVAPLAGSQRIYSQTIIDDLSHTIIETIRDYTTTVNSDGSYIVLQDDNSTNFSVTWGATTYSIPSRTITLSKSGQEVSYTISGSSTCTFSPHGAGPDYPIAMGETWTLTYTLTCGATTITYSQTGAVIGVESVTVTAGTYSAIKLQSTITWTDSSGTTYTNTVTNWREITTGISVKSTISHSYSGTAPPNGHPVTTSTELQSGVL